MPHLHGNRTPWAPYKILTRLKRLSFQRARVYVKSLAMRASRLRCRPDRDEWREMAHAYIYTYIRMVYYECMPESDGVCEIAD